MDNFQRTDDAAIGAVRHWLQTVVVGLGLCPFASQPLAEDRIRFAVTHARVPLDVLEALQAELDRLADTPAAQLETTLLIIPQGFEDFLDFNDLLDLVDALLERFGWEGEVQVASFHPHYQFADSEADDPANLSNRAPLPILHLLREASVERALNAWDGDPDEIPERNIRLLRELPPERRRALFPWLFAMDSSAARRGG